MKRAFAALLLASAVAVAPSGFAAVLFSDSFSYSNGDLTNNAPWTSTGTVGTNFVQVTNGAVALSGGGNDVNAPLSATNSGASFYIGLTLDVSEARVGDYFLHVSPAAGNTANFFARLHVTTNASGTGYLLGYLENSGTGGVTNYGSTTLNFNTPYRVVLAYNSIVGALNDTASIYVNPFDPVETNNTAYILNDPWTSTSPEPTAIGSINLRQGNAANAPALRIDDLIVATTFVEAVPEPSHIALMAVGGLGLVAYRLRAARRR